MLEIANWCVLPYYFNVFILIMTHCSANNLQLTARCYFLIISLQRHKSRTFTENGLLPHLKIRWRATGASIGRCGGYDDFIN